jgi:hypothetical protein
MYYDGAISVPFAWRFGMHWCGIASQTTFSKAIQRLLARGYIYHDRRHKKLEGSRIKYFLALGRPR